jgi:hypothetical protein
MQAKRMLLAALVGSVVMFGLGAIGHTVLLRNYREGLLRGRPLLPIIYLGILLLSLLMAYVYSITYIRGSTVVHGLKIGILFALIWTIPGGLVRFGSQQGLSLAAIFLDAAWHLIEEGAGGILIGLVCRKSERPILAQASAGPASRS